MFRSLIVYQIRTISAKRINTNTRNLDYFNDLQKIHVAFSSSKISSSDKDNGEDFMSKSESDEIQEERLDEFKGDILRGGPMLTPEQVDVIRTRFHTSIRHGHFDRAIDTINRFGSNYSSPLTLRDECFIIERLIRCDQTLKALQITKSVMAGGRFPMPRTYKMLLERMAHEGRFREIDEIIDSLPEPLKETLWFSDTVIRAYSHSKNPDIHTLLRVLKSLNPLPLFSILELLDVFPDLEEPIFDTLKTIATSRRNNLAINIIWLRLMKTGRYEEAGKLFNSIPNFKSTLVFKTLLFDIKRNKNLTLGYNLIEQLNSVDLGAKAKGVVYDAMIYALLESDKVKEAQDLLLEGLKINRAKENGLTLSDLNYDILIRLYHAVKNSTGSEPEFELPEKTLSLKPQQQPQQTDRSRSFVGLDDQATINKWYDAS